MLASLMSLGISGVSSTLYFVENARRVAVPHLLILCFVRNKKALKLSFEKTYFRRLHITRPAYLQLQIKSIRNLFQPKRFSIIIINQFRTESHSQKIYRAYR